MIVGEHSRDNDLEINVLKGKQLTNMRASGSDEAVILVPPKLMSLEEMMAYINEDELLEVTPLNLRLRKRFFYLSLFGYYQCRFCISHGNILGIRMLLFGLFFLLDSSR